MPERCREIGVEGNIRTGPDDCHALRRITDRPGLGGIGNLPQVRSGWAANFQQVGVPQAGPAGGFVAQDMGDQIGQGLAQDGLALADLLIEQDAARAVLHQQNQDRLQRLIHCGAAAVQQAQGGK